MGHTEVVAQGGSGGQDLRKLVDKASREDSYVFVRSWTVRWKRREGRA